MSIKLVDSLSPMGSFPVAEAKDIVFDDSKSLQEKYDNGELSGEGSRHLELTQSEYDALSDEEKLNGAIYFITDAIGGGDASINDNDVSLDSTWSSAKIVTEMSDNYAIFEGVIGGSYYSTTIDEEDITNAPTTLYGGWTLDRVDTNLTEGSILSAFNNATKKRVLPLTEEVRIGEVYSDSFSVYDDTMNNGGKPYKVALLWNNGDKGNKSDTYIVNCTIVSETGLEIEVANYDGDFTKIKQTIADGGKVELRVVLNSYSNYILEPSRIEDSYVTFNTVDKNTNFTIKVTEYGITDVSYIDLNSNGGATIDDAVTSTDTTWSSEKIASELGGKVYTSLAELGLTADATIDNVIDALKEGETALISTNEFTNYKDGMFPNQCTNDQYAVIKVEKESGSKVFLEWRQKAGNAYAIGGLNGNNKFTDWDNLVRFKKDGFADDSIVCIGDTVSSDGVIQTLANLGFTTDVMTWDTGVYRVSHVSGLTNLPRDITTVANPAFRLEHHDCKKWGGNHNPTTATWAIRHSVLYADGGNVYHRYTESGDTASVFIKDTGWRKINTNESVSLVTNTSTLKLDIIKKNSSWYGAIKLTYLYDTSPVEVEISFRSATDDIRWAVINGQKYINKITYTQDSSNTAHYTIGIEFAGTTYGCYQADVIGDFADINSLTSEAFTGAKTAVYYSPWGKNNGVTLVSAPEDIGLTFPCTSVQLVQAMRNKFNKTITSGAIGVFNNGGKTVCITDAPSDYGLLHIEVFGHDRVLIRYDGIGGSTYNGSWIGKIKGSNGIFSGIAWERINDEFNGSEVKSITIDLSASDLQSTGSGSVHLSLGNYINKSTKAIRAEGYYNPPSDSTYPVVIPVIFGSQAGHLSTDSTGYSFRAVQSPSGKKGSGFVKIYYVD